MKPGKRKLTGTVQRLVELSKTEGLIDPEKVAAVLGQLRKSTLKSKIHILRNYRNVIRRELNEGTARVTLVEPNLSDKDLKALHSKLEAQAGRKLAFEVAYDPDLIAGVKVAVGYHVYEKNIRAMLNQLSPSNP